MTDYTEQAREWLESQHHYVEDFASRESLAALLTHVRADEREKCAMVCEGRAERIKHTSHRDGLGMGDLAQEQGCHDCAVAIRGQGDE